MRFQTHSGSADARACLWGGIRRTVKSGYVFLLETGTWGTGVNGGNGNCSTAVTTEDNLDFGKRKAVQDESVDEHERRRSRSSLAVAGSDANHVAHDGPWGASLNIFYLFCELCQQCYV
jgi:hypothetical protein